MLAGTSDVLSFVLPTSVHSGPAPYPFRLGLVSDVGQTMNSSTTMDHLLVRAETKRWQCRHITAKVGCRSLWRSSMTIKLQHFCPVWNAVAHSGCSQLKLHAGLLTQAVFCSLSCADVHDHVDSTDMQYANTPSQVTNSVYRF